MILCSQGAPTSQNGELGSQCFFPGRSDLLLFYLFFFSIVVDILGCHKLVTLGIVTLLCLYILQESACIGSQRSAGNH